MGSPTLTEVSRRLDALNIPRSLAARLDREIQRWTEKSGPEWTVQRIKALKTDFVRLLAGKEKSSAWIDYQGKYPTGIFGDLFRYGTRNTKRAIQALNSLMVYTSYVSARPTEMQLTKFYGSLSSSPSSEDVVSSVADGIQPIAEMLSVRPKRIRDVTKYVPSERKRCPTSDGRSAPDEEWLNTLDVLWRTSLGRKLYLRYESVREAVKPLAHLVEPNLRKLPSFFWEDSDSIRKIGFAGKIGHIQEPGFKLRAVANPFRIYQLALSRFGDQLYELVESLSWDCTHDQESGVKWAEERLRSGLTMYAVDLSDATNTFPLQLQLKVLRMIKGVNEQDINLFQELSEAIWLSPTHGAVRWTKGQPLGLYPSFASFALTHGLLVASIERKLGLAEGENFRVLGDDIVISNFDVYKEYRNILEKLEVPVSEGKTLVSNRVTEFGGRIILPGTIISLGKWRLSSDRSFLDVLRNVGPKYLKYLPKRQRRVAEIVMSLPEPIGFGMNPKGLSALRRAELEEELRFLFEPHLELPCGESSQFTRALMTSEFASKMFAVPSLAKFFSQLGNGATPVARNHKEVLSQICHLTGAPFEPSSQFNVHDGGSWVDMLEKSERILKDLGQTSPHRSGDPRGATLLELWEMRFKAKNLTC